MSKTIQNIIVKTLIVPAFIVGTLYLIYKLVSNQQKHQHKENMAQIEANKQMDISVRTVPPIPV